MEYRRAHPARRIETRRKSIWLLALLAAATTGATASESDGRQINELRGLHAAWMSALAEGGDSAKQAKTLETARAALTAVPDDAHPEVLRKQDALRAIMEQPIADFVLESIAQRPPLQAINPEVCERAILLGDSFGQSYEVTEGETLWFRLGAMADRPLEISTLGSTVDSLIEVSDECGGPTTLLADDEFGLQAIGTVGSPQAGRLIAVTAANEGELVVSSSSASVISGRIVDSETLQAIEGSVYIYDAAGGYVRNAGAVNGEYLVSLSDQDHDIHLVAGSNSSADSIHIAELYDDISCNHVYSSACRSLISDHASLRILGDVVYENINFALDLAPRITGRVTDIAANAIDAAEITAVHRDSGDSRTATAMPDGSYTVQGLHEGVYDLYARGLRHQAQLFAGIDCLSDDCTQERSNELGTSVLMAYDGPDRSGVDFQLTRLGSITGTVTNSVTGLPLADVPIRIYDEAGRIRRFARSDDAGAFTAGRLYDGVYYLKAYIPDYQSTLYESVNCHHQGCDTVADGTPIDVFGPSDMHVDVVLPPLGRVSGRVTSAHTGEPVSDGEVCFYIAENRGPPWCEQISPDGSYLSPGLPAHEQWYGVAISRSHHDQVYNGIQCDAEYHTDLGTCSFDAAVPLTVPVESSISDVNFVLTRSGRVEVTVVDGDLVPIPSATVTVFETEPHIFRVEHGEVDAAGKFDSGPLPPGNYLVHVTAPGYASEAFDDVICPVLGYGKCENAVPFYVGMGEVTNLQITLGTAPTVSVTLIDENGEPLDGDFRYMPLPDDSFQFRRIRGSDTVALEPGSYLFGFWDILYFGTIAGAGECLYPNLNRCDLGSATQYDLAIGDKLSFEVQLRPRLRVEGVLRKWHESVEGFVSARAYPEDPADLSSSIDSSRFAIPLPEGRYKLIALGSHHNLFAYGSGPCGEISECRELGTTVVVDSEGGPRDIEIVLEPFRGVYGEVTDERGKPLAGITIDIWSQIGELRNTVTTDGFGRYYSERTASYHISTRNGFGYQDVIYPSIPCVGGSAHDGFCEPTMGAVVSGTQSDMIGQNRADIILTEPPLFRNGFEGQ